MSRYGAVHRRAGLFVLLVAHRLGGALTARRRYLAAMRPVTPEA